MTRILVSAAADRDAEDIFATLATTGGHSVAAAFGAALDALYLQLVAFPNSGSPRPSLGASIKIGIVRPYIIIYRYDLPKDVVEVLRILHGHRNVTSDLLPR